MRIFSLVLKRTIARTRRLAKVQLREVGHERLLGEFELFMKRLLLFATAALTTSAILADELPVLTDKPFLGAWIGYENQNFDFAINADGRAKLFVKQRQAGEVARISPFHTIDIDYSVQEKVGENWVNRTIEENAFETDLEASAEVEKVEFVATFKGGTKVKVNHVFDGEEILTRIAQVSTESENELRVGIKVAFPNLYRLREERTERELKEEFDGDEIRATRIDNKRFKLDLQEDVKLSDEAFLKNGAIEYSIESKKLGNKTISLRNGKGSKGKILFEQTQSLHLPLDAYWYPETPESTFVIEVD